MISEETFMEAMSSRTAEIVKLQAFVECQRRAIEAFNGARAAWIHHVSAPGILRELWSLSEPDHACSHTVRENKFIVACPDWNADTFIVAEWDSKFKYCAHCGAVKENG